MSSKEASSLVWLMVFMSVLVVAMIDLMRSHHLHWPAALVLGGAMGNIMGLISGLITRGIFALAARLQPQTTPKELA